MNKPMMNKTIIINHNVVSHIEYRKSMFFDGYFIEYLETELEHRGKGFATNLINQIKEETKVIRVDVKPKVIPFYEKHGFKLIDEDIMTMEWKRL